MIVGAIGDRTDVAIIGGGPGGYVAALRAADAGLDVTLIDRGPIGGVCLNVGCIPSKTLIELASIRHRAIESRGLGVGADGTVDMAEIRRQIDETTSRLGSGVSRLLDDAGVTVRPGTAHFARYDRLSIEHDGQVSHLEFEHAIVATGSRPVALDTLPFDEFAIDSTQALHLTDLPASMTVVGAGYIGVELGTAFAKLGVAVTLVEAAPHILPGLPSELGRVVARSLADLGVRIVTGVRPVGRTDDGVRIDSGETITGDLAVICVGRRPNSDTCSLEAVGVNLDPAGHVVVEPDLTAAPNIYAIGDLVAGPALAHKASAEAEVAVASILGEPARFDPAVVPAVVYSDPEIVSVGTTPGEAHETGGHVYRFPHSASARAQTTGQATGVTLVVADQSGTVVGVHAVGAHVSELAGEAALAIEMAATIEDVSLTIHPHPTMSETIAEAAWLARGSPLHIRR